MKLTWLIIFFLIISFQVNAQSFEDRYGKGVVGVKYNYIDNGFEQSLRNNINDSKPSESLLPVFPEYNDSLFLSFIFACLKDSAGWYLIEGKRFENDQLRLWIKKNDNLVFLPWEKYMKNRKWIERSDLKNNPVMSDYNSKGKALLCDTKDCLEGSEVYQNWMKISPIKFHDCSVPNPCFESGWVKWRDEKDFLIMFQ